MKKQIIVIHGGDSFNTYDEYISSLKNRDVTIDRFRPRKDWKATLSEKLGEEYDVLLPQMPNKTNAHYNEWKIWFERMFPFLNDDVVLVGHSQGGLFLARYFADNDFPKRIKGLFLVAPPHNKTSEVGDFLLPDSLDRLRKQVKNIFLYYSKDDAVVPFSELAEFEKQLPEARAFTFENRGHFLQEEFPELVKDIKDLY